MSFTWGFYVIKIEKSTNGILKAIKQQVENQ